MTTKETLVTRVSEWLIRGTAAEWDELSEEIYAAGLSPSDLWKEAEKKKQELEKEEKRIQETLNIFYENIR